MDIGWGLSELVDIKGAVEMSKGEWGLADIKGGKRNSYIINRIQNILRGIAGINSILWILAILRGVYGVMGLLNNRNPHSRSNQSSLKPGMIGCLSGLILIQFWMIDLITQNLNLD